MAIGMRGHEELAKPSYSLSRRLSSLRRILRARQADYPNRPIQLVVTVPPGGAADFVGRLIGAKLADALGQPVVISNRGGAGGTTAAAAVAKSDPDGYTLLLNTIATHGIGPHIYANLPYDPVKDFAPVILIAKLPLDHGGQRGRYPPARSRT